MVLLKTILPMYFLLIYILITVEVLWNGMTTEAATVLHLKTPDTGVMKIIGNGQQNPIQERKQVFLKENILPIQESGQLNFVPLPTTGNYGFAPDLKMDIIFVDGHTEKQMLPVIKYQERLSFCCRPYSYCRSYSISICNGL